LWKDDGDPELSIEDNRRIASDLHTALNNRDLDKAMALFADDASWIVMPGGTCYTKPEIKKYLEKVMNTYEKFLLKDVHPPVVSGDMVTHEYIHEVRLRDGREGHVPAVAVMELRDGKITQVRHYIDKLEAAKKMARGTVAKRAVAGVAKQVEAIVNP
jgi:ketosteroid isomerase-like protein